MTAFFFRFQLKIEDLFRVLGASTVKSIIDYILNLFDQNPQKRLNYSTEAVTHAPRLARIIGAWRVAEKAADETLALNTLLDSAQLNRCIVLKKPQSPRERGVLLVSFENELDKLVRLMEFPKLEREYQVLFLPTWQPFHSAALFKFKARSSEIHCLMPSSLDKERELVRFFSGKLTYLPFHAASWVKPVKSILPLEHRDIDLLMVANFARHKRHWKLFNAVRRLDRNLKIVVAGMPRGSRNLEELRKEAQFFGVGDNIDFYAAPTDEKISDLLSRAKVFCAMTHKEGSYISVAEALMHGTSVAMYSNALIGSRVYVNSKTGVFLNYFRDTGKELSASVGAKKPEDIAAWAVRNISSESNCVKLNEVLKSNELSLNNQWSRDLEPFYCAHFDFHYAGETGAKSEFADEYDRLERAYGLTIKRPQ